MGSSFRLIAWSSIGVALATSLSAETIVAAVFGEPFRMAGPVLAIYIWVLPLRLLSGHARWTLLAAERQGVLLLVELACAATIVLLCVALIPGYGAAGAALSGVLGNIVGWGAAHRAAGRFVGSLPGARQVLLPVGGAILGAAVARVAGGPVALNVLAGVLVYALYSRLTAADLFADAVRLAHAKRVTPPKSGDSAGS
jgi:O-antigen/teichoic acid export membrane protein